MIFVPPYSIVNLGSLDLHLHPDHLRDLRASGLQDETIRAAPVYSLPPGQIQLFFSTRKGVPPQVETALCFPYQGKDFARIKLFPSLGKWKYSQPPGTSARLYAPFQVAEGPLYVCEGEKKTLAAHQAGFNAVGVGGVWSWLSKGEPIGDLHLIEWDGREATLIPDSDVFERPDLLRAIYAVGRELRERGGTIAVARIPQDGPAKVGLDDYMKAGGDIEELETFGLDSRVFKSTRFWFGKWKLSRAMEAALPVWSKNSRPLEPSRTSGH